MGNTGRFGKYGDLKRKEKIRKNLIQPKGSDVRMTQLASVADRPQFERRPGNKSK